MAELITSNNNQQIKNIMALQRSKKERTRQGLFVIEGVRIVLDAVRSAADYVEGIYVSETFMKEQYGQYASELKGFCVTQVKDSVFDKMCETVTPQGIMAVVRQRRVSLEELIFMSPDAACRYLILENIQDPGNLGTMMRTAEAAGITAVIMSSDTVDIYSPKVTRSTMGSIFRVPFVYVDDLCSEIRELCAHNIRVYGAYLHGGTSMRELTFADRCGILIGNEGNGLTDEAIEAASDRVFIPMEGKVESLNAGIAAAILMYH